MLFSLTEIEAGALRHGVHVLVAAARQVHQKVLVFGQRRRELRGVSQRVAGLQRRNDALDAAAVVERLERFFVGDTNVLGAVDLF